MQWLGSGIARELEEADLLPYFRAYVRQTSARGEVVEITRGFDCESRALAHTGVPVPQKITRLLEHVARKAGPAGSVYSLPPLEELAPVLDASSEQEVRFLLHSLYEAGLLEPQDKSVANPLGTECLVTPAGWATLMPIGGARLRTCFVAMAFSPTLDDAYSLGIEPAVQHDCGMSVVRVDRVQHNESINDLIIVQVRTAQFVVADVTLHRNGVYFEGGYAMGLGRPVIWMVREDDSKNVHFDTSQLNHIVWTDPADLRTKLARRIQATIPAQRWRD